MVGRQQHQHNFYTVLLLLVCLFLTHHMADSKSQLNRTLSHVEKATNQSTILQKSRRHLVPSSKLLQFTALNDFLSDTTVEIPDFEFELPAPPRPPPPPEIGFAITSVRFFNIYFKRINIEQLGENIDTDVTLDTNDEVHTYSFSLHGLDVDCYFDYQLFGSNILSALLDGNAKIPVGQSTVDMTVTFKSDSFDRFPPYAADIPECSIKLNIGEMTVSGGFTISFVNGLIFFFTDIIEGFISNFLCEKLIQERAFGMLSNLVGNFSEAVYPYLSSHYENTGNPIANTEVPLVDFSDQNSTIGGFVDSAINIVDSYLSSEVEDPTTGGNDLGINGILRSNVLDENKTFILPLERVLFQNNTVANTTVILNSIQLRGADSFTEFYPLSVDKQTISSSLAMKNLHVESKFTIHLSNNDNPPEDGFNLILPQDKTEEISVKLGFYDLSASGTSFIGLNSDTLYEQEFGSFLTTSNLLPCALSSLNAFQLTKLNANMGKLPTLELDRVIDPSLGTLISSSIGSIMETYNAVFDSALPSFVSTTLRDNITTILNEIIDNEGLIECGKITLSSDHSALDLRDLLLNSSAAVEQGATGNKPYGDIAYTAKLMFDENIIKADQNGSPKVNSIISNFTASRFDVPGTISINESPFMCEQNFQDTSVTFELYNLSLSNTNTFSYPFEVMFPQDSSLLRNHLTMGGDNQPLQLSSQFSVDFNKGNDHNFLSFDAEIADLDVLLTVLAVIDEHSVMKMPLLNTLNPSCWLAAFQLSNSTMLSGVGIYDLEILYDSIGINFTCVSEDLCGSLRHLPTVIDVMRSKALLDVLIRNAISFLSDLVQVPNLTFDNMFINASSHCLMNPFESSGNYSLSSTESDENLDKVCFGGSDPPFTIAMSKLSPLGGKGLLFLIATSLQFILPGFVIVDEIGIFPESNLQSAESLLLQVTDISDSLLSLSHLNETFLQWIDAPLGLINSSLNDFVEDSDSQSGENIGVNVNIRRLLDDSGLLSIPLAFSIGDALNVEGIRIIGLDSFTNMLFVDIAGPQELRSAFELDHLSVEVEFSVASGSSRENEVEYFTTSFELYDIELSLTILVAIKENDLRDLQLGSIMDLTSLIECLPSTIEAFNINEFLVNIRNFTPIMYQGVFPDDVTDALTDAHEDILRLFQEKALEVLPTILNNVVRQQVNSIVSTYIDNSKCTILTQTNGSTTYLDFRDMLLNSSAAVEIGGRGTTPYGKVFPMLYNMLNMNIIGKDDAGLPKVNGIISGLTASQSNIPGTLFFPGPIVDHSLDFSKMSNAKGGLSFRLFSNTTVQNLDTIDYPFTLMEPKGGQILQNSIRVGKKDKPILFSTDIAYNSTTATGSLKTSTSLQVTVEIGNVSLDSQILAKISEQAIMRFPFKDISNINCWIATIPFPQMDKHGVRLPNDEATLTLKQLYLVLKDVRLIIECHSCDPEFAYFSTKFDNITLSNKSDLVQRGIEFVQNFIDKAVKSASSKCPHNLNYGKVIEFSPFETPDKGFDVSDLFIPLFSTLGFFFLFVFLLFFMIKRSTKQKHARSLLRNHSDVDLLEMCSEIKYRNELNDQVNALTTGLVFSKGIPLFIRILIPIILLLNVGLFISGHVDIGARIVAMFTFGGTTVALDPLNEFSALSLVERSWNKANKLIAAVIFICSVIWPYTKQALTLFLWVVPPRFFSVSRRGTMLEVLDFLSKWSFIDILIVLIAMTFFYSYAATNTEYFPEGYYSVRILVAPMWGAFANLAAQGLTQVTSHIIIYYHGKVQKSCLQSLMGMSVKDYGNDTAEKKALCNHEFRLGGAGKGETVRVSPLANISFGILGVSTLTMLIYGGFSQYLSIETTGFLGLFTEFGNGKPAIIHHSIYSLSLKLVDITKFIFPGSSTVIGSCFLAGALISTCIFVPVLLISLALLIWFVPMKNRRRDRFIYTFQLAQSWQYLEVYFIGIIIMIWQVGPYSLTFSERSFSRFYDVFAAIAAFGLVEPRHANAMYYIATVESPVAVHALGLICLWFVTHMVGRAVDQHHSEVAAAQERLHVKTIAQDAVKAGSVQEGCSSRDALIRIVVAKMKNVPLRFTDSFSFMLTPCNYRGVVYDHEFGCTATEI